MFARFTDGTVVAFDSYRCISDEWMEKSLRFGHRGNVQIGHSDEPTPAVLLLLLLCVETFGGEKLSLAEMYIGGTDPKRGAIQSGCQKVVCDLGGVVAT